MTLLLFANFVLILMSENLLCDREVMGSIPGGVIPKTLKMY